MGNLNTNTYLNNTKIINIYTFSLDNSLEEIYITPNIIACDEKQEANKKVNKPVYSGFYGPPL